MDKCRENLLSKPSSCWSPIIASLGLESVVVSGSLQRVAVEVLIDSGVSKNFANKNIVEVGVTILSATYSNCYGFLRGYRGDVCQSSGHSEPPWSIVSQRSLTLHDKVRSCEICRALNVEPLLFTIEKSTLCRPYCMSRMPHERLARQVLAKPTRKQTRGCLRVVTISPTLLGPVLVCSQQNTWNCCWPLGISSPPGAAAPMTLPTAVVFNLFHAATNFATQTTPF